MKSENGFAQRLYLTFSVCILICLGFFVVPSVLKGIRDNLRLLSYIMGCIFAVIPVFILVRALKDINDTMTKLSGFDIIDYEAPHGFGLKMFGLLPTFKVLEELNVRIKTINLENQLLYDTALAIHSASSLKQLLNTVIARLTTHSGADFGMIFLIDSEQDNNTLQLTAWFNLTKDSVVKKFFRIGEGIIGWVAREGESVLSDDVEQDRRYILCVKDTRAQMTIPIRSGNTTLGVIVLGSFERRRFKTKDLALLKNIAGEIGLAVGNTWLTQKLKEEKERVAVLYETAQQLAATVNLDDVVEIGVKTVHALANSTSCSLMLLNEENKMLGIVGCKGLSDETKKLVKLGIGEGIAGRVVQEGHPLLICDTMNEPQFKVFPQQKERFKSLFSVPLWTEDGCIGAINAATDKPLTDDKCKMIEAVASQVSVAVKNALLYESIERLAIQDGLTGLYNYRYFHQTLAKEVERARRYKRELSLVALDIDDFKKYNDNYGHMTGDYLLMKIGSIIQENLRHSDILARCGGDELAVILPETDDQAALNLIERIKNKIAEYTFETQDSELASTAEQELEEDKKNGRHDLTPSSLKAKLFRWLSDKGVITNNFHQLPGKLVTISAGICSLSDTVLDKDDLIKKADRALLQAKKMGKNQICVWNDE